MFLPELIYKRFGNIAYLLWLFGFWCALTYLILEYHHHLIFAASFGFIVSFFTVAAAILSAGIFKFYKPTKYTGWYPAVWNIFIAWFVVYLCRFIGKSLFAELTNTEVFFEQNTAVQIFVVFVVISAFSLASYVWFTQADIHKDKQVKTQQSEVIKEAELFHLRQQIQPHFIFNSLNSIHALLGSNPNKAREMLTKLASFLRGTLTTDQHTFNTINKELEQLTLYLQIEEVRFGHRLKVLLNIDEACGNKKVPALLLQPLVENAIKFGLYGSTGEVNIHLNVSCLNQMLTVTISNPFDADNVPEQKGTGFGLNSIRRRLYLIFGRNDLLLTQSKDQIFTATINIPQHD